ncbi:SMC family protein [Xylanimonas cellulosilytica DSM 15894]|uniref:SMC family protein n=1 Tax=Xylanimonas cellulosilytica (strain DSM 15894 / JCM 12276 / CECT 5975 / KCTC 9989 / LMG 20990 / NBRC 107835 / XIL07) TaxID=446471 RepID=D1BWK9_XYLCX|nr:hypothetical protein [Xylanimonas cellulosilytica]ACZ29591.1 SMC family protein [Xylanimonas cellulosilytica DSM 15894]
MSEEPTFTLAQALIALDALTAERDRLTAGLDRTAEAADRAEVRLRDVEQEMNETRRQIEDAWEIAHEHPEESLLDAVKGLTAQRDMWRGMWRTAADRAVKAEATLRRVRALHTVAAWADEATRDETADETGNTLPALMDTAPARAPHGGDV